MVEWTTTTTTTKCSGAVGNGKIVLTSWNSTSRKTEREPSETDQLWAFQTHCPNLPPPLFWVWSWYRLGRLNSSCYQLIKVDSASGARPRINRSRSVRARARIIAGSRPSVFRGRFKKLATISPIPGHPLNCVRFRLALRVGFKVLLRVTDGGKLTRSRGHARAEREWTGLVSLQEEVGW